MVPEVHVSDIITHSPVALRQMRPTTWCSAGHEHRGTDQKWWRQMKDQRRRRGLQIQRFALVLSVSSILGSSPPACYHNYHRLSLNVNQLPHSRGPTAGSSLAHYTETKTPTSGGPLLMSCRKQTAVNWLEVLAPVLCVFCTSDLHLLFTQCQRSGQFKLALSQRQGHHIHRLTTISQNSPGAN